jgi:small subunit ribosomal protein S20
LATKPRGWTGARTPSALKRVRTAERRTEINQPRRSVAKTLVSKAVKVAAGTLEGDPVEALTAALSALDRAAKAGAIHANAAARRKSRLARKFNAALGGARVQTAGKVTKTTGKAAAAKAAKSRIALGKAGKAKGAQTAAGKARAALSKTARAEAAASAAANEAKAAGAPDTAANASKVPARTKATRAKPAARATAPKAKPPARKRAAKPAGKTDT